VLPPALLFAALGFVLAFAPRAAVAPALLAALLGALAVTLAAPPAAWTEAIFLGCWLSVAATALLVHLPRGLGPAAAVPLAMNVGAWAGATVAVAGSTGDLLRALPVALIAGRLLVARGSGVAIKVVASWLVAVAMLAATLATVPTPGYVQDHMQ
jgi:hypothetical protein